ncbi:hypothetical protein V2J09_003599 [Rumex salicifolius]
MCQECPNGVDNASEDELEKELICSCCEKSFRSDVLPPHFMIKSLLDGKPKERMRAEEIEEVNSESREERCNMSNEEPHIISDVEGDSSRSTSNSLWNENEGNEDEEEPTQSISSSADHLTPANEKFHPESGDAEENKLQAKKFTESFCAMMQGVGGMLVAELEEKAIKYAELEKEVDGVTETFDSCKTDLKIQDLATGFEEEILNGNETSGNETLDDHPDEKHNEEERSVLDNRDKVKQSHTDIEEGKMDHCFDPSLVIKQLRSELEAERSAASIATNQTMAMITRLQEEKAAIKMEAVQYQRMMEEQAEYDQEALQLLNELVTKREKEKQELEKELELYREKVLNYEVRKSGCSSSSCTLNDDSEKLSIDLSREIEEDNFQESNEIPSTGAVLDSVDLVLDRVKNWNMLDGSLEEFEQERVSILHQLKDLEEKLFSICDDDQAQDTEVEEDNANLCSAEVNLAPSRCLADLTMEKDHPTTMSSAAKKLLPFLENEDGDAEHMDLDKNKVIELDQKAIEGETSDKVIAIVKEMDHVYGRLQALEADREFLRHCIGSLNKGDKGVGLLEEILQHLRELRNTDTCELMICNE